MTDNCLINVNNLSISVRESGKRIVNHVSFNIPDHKIISLVGSSGSGKTTVGLSLMKLLSSSLRIDSGEILFRNKDIIHLPQSDMLRIRGKEIGMIFQEPLNAFNPVFTIGYQIEEVLKYHTEFPKNEREMRVLSLLGKVGIDDVKRVAKSYPHQLSGGMRQRAMIAQAVANNPKLIIADEPTSSLDVTLQARMMDLFRRLVGEMNLSMLLITHDLGMVKHIADYVYVMNKGTIVEEGMTEQIIQRPQDDYTKELMSVFKG